MPRCVSGDVLQRACNRFFDGFTQHGFTGLLESSFHPALQHLRCRLATDPAHAFRQCFDSGKGATHRKLTIRVLNAHLLGCLDALPHTQRATHDQRHRRHRCLNAHHGSCCSGCRQQSRRLAHALACNPRCRVRRIGRPEITTRFADLFAQVRHWFESACAWLIHRICRRILHRIQRATDCRARAFHQVRAESHKPACKRLPRSLLVDAWAESFTLIKLRVPLARGVVNVRLGRLCLEVHIKGLAGAFAGDGCNGHLFKRVSVA